LFSVHVSITNYQDSGPALGKNGTYGALMYNAHALDAIDEFKASGAPAMFM